MIYFISGHRDITEEEFKKELNLENYVKKDDSLEDNSLTNEDE